MSFSINFAFGQEPYGFVADFGTKGTGRGNLMSLTVLPLTPKITCT